MKPNQRGWGLVETLLTLGAISAMSAAIYVALGPTSASAQVKVEQDNLRFLSQAVDRSFGLLGSYSGVSTTRVRDDGLAPTRMERDGDLRTAWGTGVGVHPYAVNAPGDAFLVAYPFAPAAVCAPLTAAMARDAYDILVEGRTVYTDGSLDPAIAAEQCGQADSASMEFVFHSGLVSGSAVAAPPLVLPPAPPTTPRPPSSPVDIPMPTTPGVVPRTPGPPVAPPPGAPAVDPPAAPAPPPAPPFLPPPALPPTPPVPPSTPPGTMCVPISAPAADNRTVACPPGQLGATFQERTGSTPYTCPEAWGNPVPGFTIWADWTTTSSSCAPVCVLPTPNPQTQTESRPATQTVACPAGQTGTIEQARTETRTGTREASCPAPVGAFVWSPLVWGGWSGGAWADTSNTCAPVASPCAWQFEVDVGQGFPTTFTPLTAAEIAAQTRSSWDRPAFVIPATCAPPGLLENHWATWPGATAPDGHPMPSCSTANEGEVQFQGYRGWACNIMQGGNYQILSQTKWTCSCSAPPPPPPPPPAAATCAEAYADALAAGRVSFQFGEPGTRAPGAPAGTPIFTEGFGCLASIPTNWIAAFPKILGAEVYWVNTGTGW